MRERGEEGAKLVCAAEVVRETGIHNTPISRSAATLSGVHIADANPGPVAYWAVITEARSLRLLPGLPLGSPYLTFRYIPLLSGLRPG